MRFVQCSRINVALLSGSVYTGLLPSIQSLLQRQNGFLFRVFATDDVYSDGSCRQRQSKEACINVVLEVRIRLRLSRETSDSLTYGLDHLGRLRPWTEPSQFGSGHNA